MKSLRAAAVRCSAWFGVWGQVLPVVVQVPGEPAVVPRLRPGHHRRVEHDRAVGVHDLPVLRAGEQHVPGGEEAVAPPLRRRGRVGPSEYTADAALLGAELLEPHEVRVGEPLDADAHPAAHRGQQPLYLVPRCHALRLRRRTAELTCRGPVSRGHCRTGMRPRSGGATGSRATPRTALAWDAVLGTTAVPGRPSLAPAATQVAGPPH